MGLVFFQDESAPMPTAGGLTESFDEDKNDVNHGLWSLKLLDFNPAEYLWEEFFLFWIAVTLKAEAPLVALGLLIPYQQLFFC